MNIMTQRIQNVYKAKTILSLFLNLVFFILGLFILDYIIKQNVKYEKLFAYIPSFLLLSLAKYNTKRIN